MSRALLIHNPAAARTTATGVKSICRVLEAEGWTVDAAETGAAGHAEDLARGGVADGVDAIVVYGGDGTIIQAIAGMKNSSTGLGLVPGGTGNLLVNNLRLPRRPARAARAIARGVTKPIDLGRLTWGDETRYFVVACGAGFDAELMAATTSEAKRKWRMGAYVLNAIAGLWRMQSVRYHVSVDGQDHDLDAAVLIVANCGEIVPPFLRLGDGVAPDDGVLDLIALEANGLGQSVLVLLELAMRRTHSSKRIRHLRGRAVRVEAEMPRPIQYDGEAEGATPFRAEVLPAGVNVIVPA